MIYIIDHNDSFTHNVVHQLSLFDKVVCDNYNQINKAKLKKASVLVFSPGPGSPKDYQLHQKFIENGKVKKKLLEFVWDFNKYCFVREQK